MMIVMVIVEIVSKAEKTRKYSDHDMNSDSVIAMEDMKPKFTPIIRSFSEDVGSSSNYSWESDVKPESTIITIAPEVVDTLKLEGLSLKSNKTLPQGATAYS